MKRRDFIAGLGGAAVVGPRGAWGRRPQQPFRVEFFSLGRWLPSRPERSWLRLGTERINRLLLGRRPLGPSQAAGNMRVPITFKRTMAGTRKIMGAAALLLTALIALATSRSAYAEVWPDPPWSESNYRHGDQYLGGPYYVAGFGNDNPTKRRRYWGGPYFVSCPGFNPPYETYRPPYPVCRSTVKVDTRAPRRIRVLLK